MTYTETAKILSEQIELLVEAGKESSYCIENYTNFERLCSDIDDTSKILVWAFPNTEAVKNSETLYRMMSMLDNCVRSLHQKSVSAQKEYGLTADVMIEFRCMRLIMQASTRIKHLLTSISNSRNRYDGEL